VIVSPALRMAAFLGGLLLAAWFQSDPLWHGLETLGRTAWDPSQVRMAWPKLGAPIASALGAGWSLAWAMTLFNRALTRARSSRTPAPAPKAPAASGAWVFAAAGAVSVAWIWAHQWGAAAAARPGAVLSAWPTWSWRLAGLTWLGLACAGIGQSVARYHCDGR